MTRDEMVALVRQLAQADGREEELDIVLDRLIDAVPNANIGDLIFHTSPELSVEEIVDDALRRERAPRGRRPGMLEKDLMVLHYKPHIPKTLDDLMSQLSFMLLKAPTYEDPEFPGRNLETAFLQLNEGLKNVRAELGEARYEALMALSEKARAHFEADPGDNNGQTRAGRQLILEMEAMLGKA